MDWDACDDCKHYPPESGGCDVEGWNQCEVEGDFVICLAFEPNPDPNEPAPIEVDPNQLELL
jgi:hypothetical protein